MSKNKKEKKQKKKQKQLEQVQAAQMRFDIIELLRAAQLDTKPNFAKFIDQYVERITVCINNGKMQFYPTTECKFSKIFVKFLDGHELIYAANVIPGNPHCSMYDGLDDVPLKPKDIALVEMFFAFLQQFKFVRTFEDT